MTAKKFLSEFTQAIENNITKATEVYNDKTGYTKFIIDLIDVILKTDKNETNKEYFRIDKISFTKVDYKPEKNIKSFNIHSWNLDVAVEHENESADWMAEVVKLAHICCPLRVVIGYVPFDKRDFDMIYLDCVTDVVMKLDCKDNFERGEFLIILGNCKAKNQKDYFNYKGYLFNSDEGKFVEIISKNRLFISEI